MATFNRQSDSSSKAIDRSPWGFAQLKLERCEDRLVLSAIPMLDISHHLIEDSMVATDSSPELPSNDSLSSQPTTIPQWVPLASAAHEQTGWTDVQRLFGLRGDRQTVAVIDSGIAWDHVALGQGFGQGYRVVGGWDFAENDARPYDDAPAGFHGTHVAGIIGADDPTRSGVAPDVDLVALRVFDDTGKGQLAWTENALRWVHQNRNSFASPITTVNLSLGSNWNSGTVPPWGTLEDELLQLQQDGIVVVASAGNSFKQNSTPGLSYPAASPYVIPVAAVDANGQLSDFSQRHERAIGAPGRQIPSTVPDHVLGSDGIVNDWSAASGTSMAAPYVSGSAVLIREAMEMVGRTSVTPQEIYQWMSETADTIWDSVTKATYERLNLGRAIDTLLPDDHTGDQWGSANSIELQDNFTTNGWINTLGDRDAYRFTASSDGVLNVSAQSSWLQGVSWSLWTDGQSVELAHPSSVHLDLQAGHSYALAIADADQIGSYALQWDFTPTSHSNDQSDANRGNDGTRNDGSALTDLGSIDYREFSNVAGRSYSIEASIDGTLSIVVQTDHPNAGILEVRNGQGTILRDSTIENGQWRIDVDATEGSKWTVHTPGMAGSNTQMILANVLHRAGSTLDVYGTENADVLEADLEQGLTLQFGKVAYVFNDGGIAKVNVDLASGSDSIRLHGSSFAEKVELKPEHSTVENQRIAIDLKSTEHVDYSGGGGSDRVYLYGSTSDDTLTARPRDVEFTGSGFRFHVDQVERTYVNAEQGGQDFAYFYDSAGDDRLSVRPQFSSISGKDFFNYASGIERVYAYSNAGGTDSATLYDSVANDTYYTSGDIASLVGSGFFSYTRYFENVEAVSSTGGKDIASVYATDRNSLLVGSDFAGYQDSNWSRIARGFATAKTYVDNQLIETKAFSESLAWQANVEATIDLAATAEMGMPILDAAIFASTSTSTSFVTESRMVQDSDSLAAVSLQCQPVEVAATSERGPLGMVTLNEVASPNSVLDFDWPDLHLERQLLNEVFAQHGMQ